MAGDLRCGLVAEIPPTRWIAAQSDLSVGPELLQSLLQTTPPPLLFKVSPLPPLSRVRRLRARVSTTVTYRARCRRIEQRERAGCHDAHRIVTVKRRLRDYEARLAVLERCQGRCENPDCLRRELPYRTVAGEPLLEVDHVDEHASGGRDHPSAMIALCPNCHANKTRGAGKYKLTAILRRVALAAHNDLLGAS
ncbi:HNH endonuclease [Streptomyces atratus]|uniref:HNH endonuclease n=1 Tax=Streptomyces atratus TaxID=1893 RepID=UPI003396168F